MKTPVEFRDLGSTFYAGSIADGMSAEEWIRESVSMLNTQQKRICMTFLDALLAGEPDIRQLQAAWKSSGSNFHFRDADLLVFLNMVRKALAR